MKVLGNILWFVCAGLWLALGYVIAAVVQACTIIGIPFAVQSLKLAGYALWPFGRVVVKKPGGVALRGIGNFLWFFLSGIWLAGAHVLLGLVLCATIIGIPLGIGCMKMARLAILPFGKDIVPANQAATYGQIELSIG